ncbi:hypothetical protein MHU86_2982 [Fragilaria crotonensis]|nr:hypothetical protein MHU86_2982 [Fragilaria crotonensis]
MKEQWFILFDRLAVLHHETLPKRFHTDCEIDEVYLTWCDKIQRHNWPPFAVTTKRPPLVQPLPVAPLHSTDLFVEPPLVEPLPVDPAPPEEAGHSPPPPEEPSEELVPPLPVDPAPPEEAGHSPPPPEQPSEELVPPLPVDPPPPEEAAHPPPPPEQPSEELVPPEEPSRQIKVWEHVETSDGTSDITTLNTWPQIPKLNPIRDDWDGKLRKKTRGTRTGKAFVMETRNTSSAMKNLSLLRNKKFHHILLEL